MLRMLCNYLRSCWCRHDFELLARVEVHGKYGSIITHDTYRCKKCGFVQRVKL